MKKSKLSLTVLASLLLVGACSTTEQQNVDSQSVSSTPTETSNDAGTTAASSDLEGYPQTWEDKIAGRSNDEMIEDFREDILDAQISMAEFHDQELDIKLDNYPIVRVVSLEESAEVQAQCMRDQGFEATSSPDGSWQFEPVTSDQTLALNRAHAICLIQYPLDPLQYGDLPTTAISELYDHYTSAVVPCIENLGYSVDEPPTKETWIEKYPIDGGVWTPYDPLHDLVQSTDYQDRLDEAYTQCPRYPDDFWPSY